jgi:hypothetical protein
MAQLPRRQSDASRQCERPLGAASPLSALVGMPVCSDGGCGRISSCVRTPVSATYGTTKASARAPSGSHTLSNAKPTFRMAANSLTLGAPPLPPDSRLPLHAFPQVTTLGFLRPSPPSHRKDFSEPAQAATHHQLKPTPAFRLQVARVAFIYERGTPSDPAWRMGQARRVDNCASKQVGCISPRGARRHGATDVVCYHRELKLLSAACRGSRYRRQRRRRPT